jgi:sterol desaturase/sphingolipid hydroxylase (fatty acid hydroxylase superfamily)
MEFEAALRLSVFFGLLIGMAAWEIAAPRRPATLGRKGRWPANLGIAILDSLLVRVMLPGGAVAFAVSLEMSAGETGGSGLLPRLGLPDWAAFIVAIALLDLAIYFQHRIFHAVPALWRLHRMHHSDVDLDVTSGARFHPVEILLSIAIKLGVIAALGAPAAAVLAFEIVLNACSMFNHANVAMPARVERVLRLLLVTPDLHRIHHSRIAAETNSNFGFSVPWWDRLFGTLRNQPAQGQLGMTIGLDIFNRPQDQKLAALLIQPLRKSP